MRSTINILTLISKENINSYIRTFLANRFFKNLSYMGLSQIANRIIRLIASITIARILFPEDFGIAALALTVNELVHVFIRGTVTNKIVQCNLSELDRLCNSAYWINWLLCIVLFIIQSILSVVFMLWHDNLELGLAIMALGLTYFVLPFATIQSALVIRNNQLDVTAKSETLQTVVDSGMTIILAISGFGFWSLIIPKLLAAPTWAVIYRYASKWRPAKVITFDEWRVIFSYSKHVVIADFIIAIRNHIDYLLIGSILGLEALGIYFFAYNAGIGISQGFINAYTTTLYPHLCEADSNIQMYERYKKALITISRISIPVILFQVLTAPIYVPLLFGERWINEGALPILMIICISAITRPFAESATQLLRASNRPDIDALWQFIFTLFLYAAVITGIEWGLTGVSIAILVTHILLQPLFTYWVGKQFNQKASHGFILPPRRKQPCRTTP